MIGKVSDILWRFLSIKNFNFVVVVNKPQTIGFHSKID